MSTHFRRLGSEARLSERVEAEIERAILTGKLKVNEQLPTEADLGSSFGVSRTVVREAVQRLAAQGLINSRSGSGNYVASYSITRVQAAIGRFAALNEQRETFLELLDLRQLIEAETCERFAVRRDAASLAALGDILRQMRETRTDLHAFGEADLAFHLRIAQDSGNAFFSAILEAARNIFKAFGETTYESRKTIDRTYRDHAAIFNALMNGDAAVARARMMDHLQFSRLHYVALLGRRGLKPTRARVSNGRMDRR